MVVKNDDKIYIVITQTGTILSKILKLITGAKYNHVSLSISEEIDTLYSFGRKNAYNPFWAGFVTESPNYGTFKRFKNTKALILELNVGEKKPEIVKFILDFADNKKKYHYNYLGLFSAIIKISLKRKKHFYCSEFVRFVFKKFMIKGIDDLPDIIQPIHFFSLPDVNVIYKGKLCDYSKKDTLKHI